MISFFEKAHLNSSVRLLLELHCVIVIKHVTFFTMKRIREFEKHSGSWISCKFWRGFRIVPVLMFVLGS